MGSIILFDWSVCSVYGLGIKRSTKLQISKSTTKGDISFKKKIIFQELQRTAHMNYSIVCPGFVISQSSTLEYL